MGLGPFRFTTTKKKLAPTLGLEGYRNIVAEVNAQGNKLPIVAIGGITNDDLEAIMATGVQGVAMSGSIINADDPAEYTKTAIEILNKTK